MGRLCSNMNYTSIEDVIQQGLHEYIDGFQKQLNFVGEAIRDEFFQSRVASMMSQQQSASETIPS